MSSLKRCLLSKVSFHKRWYSIKVVFHQGLSSMDHWVPLKVVIHQRLSSIKGIIPLKFVFHKCLPSMKGHPLLWVIFHRVESMCKIPGLQFAPYRKILVRDALLHCSYSSCDIGKQSQPLVCSCLRSLTIWWLIRRIGTTKIWEEIMTVFLEGPYISVQDRT